MEYQIGSPSIGQLVDANTVFYTDVAGHNLVNPRAIPVPGGEEYESMDGWKRWRGFRRTKWHFDLLALSSYEMVVGLLCAVTGTGTIARNSGDHTQVDGTTTAFTTELSIGDTLLASLGSGLYVQMVVSSITDNDTLNVSAPISAALSGATFLYRPQAIFSGDCYVSTLVATQMGTNVYDSFVAVAHCPDPSKLTRSGRRYENLDFEFILISNNVPPPR